MTLKSFTKNVDNYYRDYDIVNDGLDQYALYLNKATNQPLEVCRDWLKKKIKNNTIPIKNPLVTVLRRDRTTGDREVVKLRFTQLINDIKSNNLILSPSFTALVPSSVEQSISAIYMISGKKKRGEYKAKEVIAEQEGNTLMAEIYKASQTKTKTDINSLSGVRAMTNTPLYVKSAHPILTSGCRVTVSYTNAINEEMLAGNRHYWSPNIAIAEILAIIQIVDLKEIRQVVSKYNLTIPTAEDCLNCVKRGSELSWYGPKNLEHIYSILVNLSNMERVAFLYVNDLYHLSLLNESLIDTILLSLSKDYTDLPPLEDNDTTNYIELLSPGQDIFLKTIVYKNLLVAGKSLSYKQIAIDYPDRYSNINRVAKNIIGAMTEYDDFFHAFFMTRHLPPAISALPEIIRRTVPGSDTDSSIFTVEGWTDRLVTKYPNRDRVGLANSIVYLTTQIVDHVVALSCGNMGIEKKNMFKIKMKNEFFFPVLSLTNNAKHYFAYQQFKDGGLLPKLKEEIKGAGLKDSKLPEHFKKTLSLYLNDIMSAHLYNIPIKIEDVFTDLYNLEILIKESILRGDCEYLKRDGIKESYKNEKGSKLVHYKLWQSAFARKYGEVTLPYRAIKVPLDTNKKNKIAEWVNSISDRHIATMLQSWLESENKENGVNILLLPEYNIKTSGIPEELRDIVNVRGLQREMMMPFYMALESLGLFLRGKSIDTLVSDFYTPLPNTGMMDKVKAYKLTMA